MTYLANMMITYFLAMLSQDRSMLSKYSIKSHCAFVYNDGVYYFGACRFLAIIQQRMLLSKTFRYEK
jgi:hypothetical protein